MKRVTTLSVLAVLLAGAAPRESAPPRAVIPYRTNGTLVSLPVRINGAGTQWYVLDSGARNSVVDAAGARRAKLRVLSTDRGAGAGRGAFAQQRLAPLDLSIGPLTFRVSAPVAIDLAHTGVQEHEDGLVGVDVLRRYVVRIDPIARTASFYDPAGFRCPARAAIVPITSPANRLYVDMRLTVNGRSVVRSMRIDTGSEDAASDNLVRTSPRRRRSLQGVGLGTPYVDYSGVFDAVQIGPYAIRDAWGASNDRPAVGMEILRRFTTTFDIPAGRLCLEPNRRFNDPVPAPPR